MDFMVSWFHGLDAVHKGFTLRYFSKYLHNSMDMFVTSKNLYSFLIEVHTIAIGG